MIKIAVITLSDKGSQGEREDKSGAVIKEKLASISGVVEYYKIIADDIDLIKQELIHCSDTLKVDLVFTTGGTGFGSRDNTPEATKDIIQREAPGIAEAMRNKSATITPKAMLSRAVAGIRQQTLIINLPGSPKGVRECLDVVLPVLPHGIEILTGKGGECGQD